MPLYIALSTFTDQGIRGVKDTLKRTDAVKQLAKRFGVTMTQMYWTMGRCDIVTVIDAPDDESAAAFALAVGAEGNVRTETMRAFTSEDMEPVLEQMA